MSPRGSICFGLLLCFLLTRSVLHFHTMFVYLICGVICVRILLSITISLISVLLLLLLLFCLCLLHIHTHTLSLAYSICSSNLLYARERKCVCSVRSIPLLILTQFSTLYIYLSGAACSDDDENVK